MDGNRFYFSYERGLELGEITGFSIILYAWLSIKRKEGSLVNICKKNTFFYKLLMKFSKYTWGENRENK